LKTALILPAMLLLAACGARDPSVPATATPDRETPPATTGLPAEAPYERVHELLGVKFSVAAANAEMPNPVVITTTGLEEDNSAWTDEVDGVVRRAEVADLDVDGSPEIYVYVESGKPDPGRLLVAYAANNRKSLSSIQLPPLEDLAGYQGKDEFAVVENVLARRFPLYDGNGAATGKMRQLQYKLAKGEAGWILRLDRTVEF
jgi:hypothetical protein